jgi:hypothetical protein
MLCSKNLVFIFARMVAHCLAGKWNRDLGTEVKLVLEFCPTDIQLALDEDQN